MKTINEIKAAIKEIDEKMESDQFQELDEQQQAFVLAVNESCKGTLEWVLSE